MITGPEYAAGLEGIRAMAPERWGTYYAEGDAHTFLSYPDRYFGPDAETSYAEWLGDLLEGDARDVTVGSTQAVLP